MARRGGGWRDGVVVDKARLSWGTEDRRPSAEHSKGERGTEVVGFNGFSQIVVVEESIEIYPNGMESSPLALPRLGLIGIVAKEMEQDMAGTCRRLKEMGYEGLEISLRRIDEVGGSKRMAEVLAAAGLELVTLMVMKEQLHDEMDAVERALKYFQCVHVTVPHGPAESLEGIKKDAALYNEVGRRLHGVGAQLCYHNHEHEFLSHPRGTGHTAMDVLLDATTPETLALHLDVAWAAFGGVDPVVLLERYAGRVPVVHVKDLYSLKVRGCFTCPGTGLLDIAGIVRACQRGRVKWLTVEQDQPRRLRGFELAAAARNNLVELGLELPTRL